MEGYFYYEGGILKHYRTPGSKNGISKTPGYTAQGQVAQLTSDGHYASQFGSPEFKKELRPNAIRTATTGMMNATMKGYDYYRKNYTPEQPKKIQSTKTQSQILAQDPYYTGNKVREEDLIQEQAHQKAHQKVQSNPAAFAGNQQGAYQAELARQNDQKRKNKQASMDAAKKASVMGLASSTTNMGSATGRRYELTKDAERIRRSIDNSDKEQRYRRMNRSAFGNLMVDATSDVGKGIAGGAKKVYNSAKRRGRILASYARQIRDKFKR